MPIFVYINIFREKDKKGTSWILRQSQKGKLKEKDESFSTLSSPKVWTHFIYSDRVPSRYLERPEIASACLALHMYIRITIYWIGAKYNIYGLVHRFIQSYIYEFLPYLSNRIERRVEISPFRICIHVLHFSYKWNEISCSVATYEFFLFQPNILALITVVTITTYCYRKYFSSSTSYSFCISLFCCDATNYRIKFRDWWRMVTDLKYPYIEGLKDL